MFFRPAGLRTNILSTQEFLEFGRLGFGLLLFLWGRARLVGPSSRRLYARFLLARQSVFL